MNDNNNTALVIVDPYNDFISEGGKIWPYVREVAERIGLVANMRRLLEAARAQAMQVVFVPHHQFDDGDFEGWKFLNPTHAAAKRVRPFVRGSWGAQFHPDFQRRAGDVVAQEHWLHNGFAATDLDYLLRQRGIGHLVICGMRANTCIEATARAAVELGYHVTLVRDATACPKWEELQATMELNAPLFAHRIATAEEVVAAWGEALALVS